MTILLMLLGFVFGGLFGFTLCAIATNKVQKEIDARIKLYELEREKLRKDSEERMTNIKG